GGGHAARRGRRENEVRRASRDEIARLVLAEEPCRRGKARRYRFEPAAGVAGQRHLGGRDRETAVREVMAGADPARRDQGQYKFAVAPLGADIDGRRRALLAAEDGAKKPRSAEPAARRPKQHPR